MCCKGFTKRVVPFFITFAVGLFIASFFVSIAAPNLRFGGERRRHREYDMQREVENQQLREENFRLKNKNQVLENNSQDFLPSDLRYAVPPVPPMPPMPPAPSSIKLNNVSRQSR